MELELIAQIFEICILPLLGILTTYFIKWINIKMKDLSNSRENEKEQKYIEMLNNTITECVMATTQTYVDALKKQGAFDIEAQKTAFNMTFTAVTALLTDEAQKYLNEAVGDLTLYITQKIEAEVQINK